MNIEACFRLLAERLKDEVIVTSAGNCSELWWEITGETERVFYLEASIESRLSIRGRHRARRAGAYRRGVLGRRCVLHESRDAAGRAAVGIAEFEHFVVENGCYGSTNDLAHPFGGMLDYAAMAKAAGIARVYDFSTVEGLAQGLDEVVGAPGHAFAVLHVEPLGRHAASPPLDGPEVKFRFGRYLERTGGRPVFDTPLHRPQSR